MLGRASALPILILAAAAVAAPTYRWVDADGNVHYSDRPQPGAEEVILPEAQTFESTPIAPPAVAPTPPPTPQAPAAPVDYSVQVVSPTPDEVLWNIQGDLSMRVSLAPSLRAGHAIRVVYDGRTLDGLPETELALTIPEVYRGTHTLAAAVVDDTGREIARSPVVTFHVRQASIIN